MSFLCSQVELSYSCQFFCSCGFLYHSLVIFVYDSISFISFTPPPPPFCPFYLFISLSLCVCVCVSLSLPHIRSFPLPGRRDNENVTANISPIIIYFLAENLDIFRIPKAKIKLQRTQNHISHTHTHNFFSFFFLSIVEAKNFLLLLMRFSSPLSPKVTLRHSLKDHYIIFGIKFRNP